MKKKSLLLLVVVLCIASGCSSGGESAPPASSAEYDTIEPAAEAGNARIGEYQHPYAVAPGSGMSFEAIYYTEEFAAGQTLLKDVIVAEVITTWEALQDFLSNGKVYFMAIHQDTTANSNIGVASYRDRDADKLYILLESEEGLTGAKYFVMGGLDPQKNADKARIIFEIGEAP